MLVFHLCFVALHEHMRAVTLMTAAAVASCPCILILGEVFRAWSGCRNNLNRTKKDFCSGYLAPIARQNFLTRF